MRRLLHRLVGPVLRPVARVAAVLATAGVGIAVVKLLEGALLGSAGPLLRIGYAALAAGLVVLAVPIIDAARPVNRRGRPPG